MPKLSATDLYGAFAEQPIAFNRFFSRICESVDAGLFLAQADYWSRRSTVGDGWFWKTAAEWEEETTIKPERQASIRKLLVKKGFISEVYRRFEHKLYFRINVDAILTALESLPPPKSKNREQAPSQVVNRLSAESGTGSQPVRSNSVQRLHAETSFREYPSGVSKEEAGKNSQEPDETPSPRSSTTQSDLTTESSQTPRPNIEEAANPPKVLAPLPFAADAYLTFYKSATGQGYLISKPVAKRLQNAVAASGMTAEGFRAFLEAARRASDPFLAKQVMDVTSLLNNWGKLVAACQKTEQPDSGGGF